jgi:hypothetical protein
MPLLRSLLLFFAVALVASIAAGALAADGGCRALSGPKAPAVVELYTSEGCNSCPPADRWLSALKDRPDVVPLAFHVDYWDSLGWKDRFAQAQFSQRQVASQRTSGAKFPYTPQVIVDGRDMPGWAALPATALGGTAAGAAAPLALALERQGDALQLTVTPRPGAALPAHVAGYVVVVDDGLQTRVGAGENKGATLRQDAVVRELLPWSAAAPPAAQTLRFAPKAAPEAGAPRHWVAVALDADTGRPLQAVTLDCAR